MSKLDVLSPTDPFAEHTERGHYQPATDVMSSSSQAAPKDYSLSAKLIQMGFTPEQLLKFANMNSDQAQEAYAGLVRKITVDYLRSSDGFVATSFRAEYLASGCGDYNGYLDYMARDKSWGGDIEAAALGEMLNIHMVAIPVTKGVQGEPIPMYRAEDDNADTIVLVNYDKKHWGDDNIHPDGNCFFNNVVVEMQRRICDEIRQQHGHQREYTRGSGLFASTEAVQKHQQRIEQAVQNAPKPSDYEATERMRQLVLATMKLENPERYAQEMQQQQESREAALEIARDGMRFGR